MSVPLIHKLFEDQASKTPNRVALEFEGSRQTYRELDRSANRVANRLRELKVGPEVLVGICVERSLDMVRGLLGVLKAGGAYVPLDPVYPKERLAFMLADSKARVLLTQDRVASTLPEFRGTAVVLDSAASRLDAESEENPRSDVLADNLAYVIYTSGSTGKPKGVAIAHRSVAAFLTWAIGAFSEAELSGVLASTSICFDLSVFELFAPLVSGGTVILARNALALPQLPAAGEVTLVNTVPSAMAELSRMEGLPSSVKTVNLAGEALPRPLVEKIYARRGVERVLNLYGPTETTTYSTVSLVGREQTGPPAIGRPIVNTRVELVDSRFQPVPAGVAGELFIGGDGLARGYLGRPELTAERFVPDPFGAAGERLYRTGDLARYRPDGEIEFLGRGDYQVKIRGFRIELGEIEEALRVHPSVEEAVVVAREEGPGEKRLVAYLAFGAGAAPRVGDLRDFLKGTLPEHMVPSVFVTLANLPRTLNGKVDREALPAPGEGRPELSQPYAPASGAVEKKLVRLWEEVLNVSPIGIRDDFLELGGHSLQAARLFARIEKVLGRDLPPTTLFRAPTIEELARILSSQIPASRLDSLVPVQPRGSRPPLFGIHGGAGTILLFQGLARHLGDDQPLYGLQARGLYGGATPHTRIDQMAADYLDEIREVQPDGPYYLVGFCSGGLVAFEMARQLRAEGQKVALLAGINAVGPAPPRNPEPATPRKNSGAAGEAPRTLRAILRSSARRLRTRTRTFARKLLTRLFLAAGAPLPQRLRQASFMSIASKANAAYDLREVHPGRMVHFRAEAIPSEAEYRDPELGWAGLAAGGLEIHVVPGVHRTHRAIMDEPAVRTLAVQVASVLSECQASASPPQRARDSAIGA